MRLAIAWIVAWIVASLLALSIRQQQELNRQDRRISALEQELADTVPHGRSFWYLPGAVCYTDEYVDSVLFDGWARSMKEANNAGERARSGK